jgi:hypothetical protein
MPDHRQKKLAKQKKKRAHASRAGVSYAASAAVSQAERKLASQMPGLPPGPCFITRRWRNPSEPRLQCLVATRQLDDATLIPVAILLDLGSQGVRDAYFAKPVAKDGIEALVELMRPMFPRGFEPIEPRVAAALVHQATEFAQKNGFEVPEELAPILRVLPEERDPGLEVELGRGGKPLYTPQPGEDTRPDVKRLVQALGPDGFGVDLTSQAPGSTHE